jgi:membrane dipeptidase
MSYTEKEAKEFLKSNFYFDIHGHKENLFPLLWRVLKPGSIPKDVSIARLAETGVKGFIVCAIGDPKTFSKKKIDSFALVLDQLKKIKASIYKTGGVVATTNSEVRSAIEENRSVFVLGIEGGDFIEEDLGRLSIVFGEGIRVLQLVHFSKNNLGSIAFGWNGKIIPKEEQTGLTQFGKTIVKKANEMGIIIDLAHADEKTVFDTLAITNSPVICSHTGPRALQDFPRYISDKAMSAIAASGGIVGLWPFYNRGTGVENTDLFARYIQHVVDLIGARHVAIGTDINGVPGNMKGYKNLYDAYRIVQILSEIGLSDRDIEFIVGGNFFRLMAI